MSEGLTMSQLQERNALLVTENESLKAQRDALVTEVVNIREQAEDVYAAGYNHGHLNTVDGIAYAPGIKDEFYHNALQVMLEVETPATEAWLNSVRADAVVNAAAHLGDMAAGKSASTAEMIKSGGRALLAFAAKLRAGEPS